MIIADFSNLGVKITLQPTQTHIKVIKNNRPTRANWPPHPDRKYRWDEYVCNFRLIDKNKGQAVSSTVSLTMEVKYRDRHITMAENNILRLGLFYSGQWHEPTPVQRNIITHNKIWFGSYVYELDLPADPMVAWGP